MRAHQFWADDTDGRALRLALDAGATVSNYTMDGFTNLQLCNVTRLEIAQLWLNPRGYLPATINHPLLGPMHIAKELALIQFLQGIYGKPFD